MQTTSDTIRLEFGTILHVPASRPENGEIAMSITRPPTPLKSDTKAI